MRPYYNDNEIKEPSFLSKISGYALWAGAAVAGVGLGAKKGAFQGILQPIFDTITTPKVLSSLGKTTMGNLRSAQNNFLSDEAKSYIFGLKDISSSILSEGVSHKRTNTFVESLRDFVQPDSLEKFDDIRSTLKANLRDPLKATNVNEAKRSLINSNFLDDFHKLTEGISFSFADRAEASHVLANVANKAYQHKASRQVIMDAMDSHSNKEVVVRAISNSADEQRGKRTIFNSLMNGSKHRPIKFGELVDDQGVTPLGQDINKLVRSKAQLGDETDFVQETMKSFREGLGEAFGDETKSIADPNTAMLANDFQNKFLASNSGFVMDSQGKILEQALGDRLIKQAKQGLLKELNLPLLPGVLNINIGKLYNFMREDSRYIRNLGLGKSHSEIRKMGFEFSDAESLIGVGKRIIKYDSGDGVISELPGAHKMLPKRVSHHTASTARIRGADPQSLQEQYEVMTGQPGLFKKVKSYLGSDPDEHSGLSKYLIANQHKFATPIIREGKIVVLPNESLLGVNASIIQTMFKDVNDVKVSELSPRNIEALMGTDHVEFSPVLKGELGNYYAQQAASNPVNIGPYLKEAADNLTDDDLMFEGHKIIPDYVLELARHSEDPATLYTKLEELSLFDNPSLQSMPSLFKAVGEAKVDKDGFFTPAGSNKGGLGGLLAGFIREDVPNKLHVDIQASLLEQIQSAYGLRALKDAGVTEGVLKSALEGTSLVGFDSESAKIMKEMISKNLLIQPEEKDLTGVIRSMLNGITDKNGDLNTYQLNSLSQLVGFGEIKATANNDITSKLIYQQTNRLRGLQLNAATRHLSYEKSMSQGSYAVLSDQIDRLSRHKAVADTINKRFYSVSGKQFEPYNRDIGITTGTDYFVVGSNGSNKIVETVRGLVSPDAHLNSMSYLMTTMGQMSNRIGADAGIGLSVQDRMTLLRSASSMFFKRALPLMVGYEAYNNLNAEADRFGIPGIDDVAGNSLANLNLIGATFKDATGLTSLHQRIVDSVPGLDMYFSPRSREEYEEYLAYGNEAVRSGRGWVIGNRSFVLGGKVNYHRPNFFRRWTSGWQSAANADLRNAQYSFLPSLTQPLAPLNRLFNPGWFEEKHLDDRPYQPNDIPEALGTKKGLYEVLYGNGTLSSGYGQGGGTGFGFGGGSGTDGGGGGSSGIGFGDGGYMSIPGPGGGGFSRVASFFDKYRDQSGLYGAFMKLLPSPSIPEVGTQQSSDAIGIKRKLYLGEYGEASMYFGEYFRRIFGFPEGNEYDYSPYRNNMPSWVSERHLHYGDPYIRVGGMGELMLPGEAFEMTHPWVRPMKLRGSMIGLNANEIVQKILDPLAGEGSDYTDYGSWAHHAVQKQLNESGMLLGAEVPIYDHINNITGTVDAIVRGQDGRGQIVEIKTQNDEDFQKGITSQKYLDQLNFYLMTTETDVGYLAFVNSSDPSQVRFEKLQRDPERYNRTLRRVEEARSILRDMIDRKQISPFETYDILARMEVLSKVSPNSAELDKLMEKAATGGLSGQEELIYHRIKSEVNEARKLNRTYAYRGIDEKSVIGQVLAINPDGTLTTSRGNIRLAGVEFDRQAFAFKDATEIYQEFGIKPGEVIMYSVNGGLDQDTMTDSTSAAIVGSINKRIIRSKYAKALRGSDDPMDYALDKKGFFQNTLEWVLHRDNIISNKFFRVRSALEQYKRGEVYGTDFASWSEPIDSFVKPTIRSIASKDPLTAGLQSAFIASMFMTTRKGQGKAALIAGVLGGTLASLRAIKETFGGKWSPGNYRKQNRIDEYYDILKYVKYSSIAERAKLDAFRYEGTNLEIDKDTTSAYRHIADQAERKASETMYAFDVAKGTLDDAIAALPYRHQQVASEIIKFGTNKEKSEYYRLLPDAEKRVLGKFLGLSQIEMPRKPTLDQYFKKNVLPDGDWEGWSNSSDLDLMSRVTSEHEDTDIVRMSKKDHAIVNNGKRIEIPRFDHPSFTNIRKRLNAILARMPSPTNYTMNVVPADQTDVEVNVDLNVRNDQKRAELIQKDMKRA